MENKLIIFENALDEVSFEKIYNFFIDKHTPWYYIKKQVNNSINDDRGFFSHIIFDENKIFSPAYDLMFSFLEKINVVALIKLRANFNFKSDVRYESEFHTDFDYKEALTAILYLNTCNGYTEFNDDKKTKIISKKNKLVIFNNKFQHKMVSQTDENFRLVINVNFFAKNESK